MDGSQAITIEQDVVLARQTVRRLAIECGLRLVDQTKLITAASELARNTVIYGGGGHMDWEFIENGTRRGLRLVFRDEGPGIPVEAREKVFTRFHSLRPEAEDFSVHSGLGLAIGRTIAEAHDGTLEVHDQEHSGACLVLTLPAA